MHNYQFPFNEAVWLYIFKLLYLSNRSRYFNAVKSIIIRMKWTILTCIIMYCQFGGPSPFATVGYPPSILERFWWFSPLFFMSRQKIYYCIFFQNSFCSILSTYLCSCYIMIFYILSRNNILKWCFSLKIYIFETFWRQKRLIKNK